MNRIKILKNSDAEIYTLPSLEAGFDQDREQTAGGSKGPDTGLTRREEHGDDILKKANEIQKQAYEEGFRSGEKAGFDVGQQKALVLTERLEKIIEELTGLKAEMSKDLEGQMVELAVAIARKLIVEEIKTRPEIIISMVREAMKRLQRVGTITIKINPALHDLFNEKKKELLDVHEDIIFDVNPNVPVTGPLVISETQEVITDIDSLLAVVVEEMKKTEEKESSAAEETDDDDGTAGGKEYNED